MNEWERIFISSTCRDLIDLRQEIRLYLEEEMGFRTYLSERPVSEFKVDGYSDTIETCLANVRDSDLVIVILSRNYGATLKGIGYGDYSATHLEYNEAIKNGKGLFVFIRDKLDGDYGYWKSNGKKEGLAYKWVSSDDSKVLLPFIESHREPINGEKPKWVWTFTDSTDMKKILSSQLSSSSGKLLLKKMYDRREMPILLISAGKKTCQKNIVKSLSITITNGNKNAANDLSYKFASSPFLKSGSIHGRSKGEIYIGEEFEIPCEQDLMLRYKTDHGHEIEEAYKISFDVEKRSFVKQVYVKLLSQRRIKLLGPSDHE